MSDKRRLLAVARRDAAPDLVVRGARVFSAFTKEWLDADVAVAGGRIAGLGRYPASRSELDGEVVDGSGRYLVPGFVDAHVHIESSKLMVDEFARAVLPHGTTAVVTDPHEIANVLGKDGIHWLLDACAGLPLEVFVMAPSNVPASPLESPREPLDLDSMRSVLTRRRALGVAEMMNFPAVIRGDPAELAKTELEGATHVDGHAPGLVGGSLDAYLATGIASDHESTTYEEALEKRRKGMWVLVREASNARNLAALIPLITAYGPEHLAFCTDDREPDFIAEQGHINQMCRAAVASGVPAEDALLLASTNAAQCHGLKGLGAIAPGYKADFMLLPDLEGFRPERVFKAGKLVASGGQALPVATASAPEWVLNTVNNAPVAAADLAVPWSGGAARVIGIVPGQLLTRSLPTELGTQDGVAVTDPDRDIAKVAVIERHHATGRAGVGFVSGFGLQRGAFASTVAHDAHNIIVVGVSDSDMAACVARLKELQGGIVVLDGGRVLAELPLRVAGLLSQEPYERVVGHMEALHDAIAGLGVKAPTPFMTLSFLALSVIPELKITDRGLVDVSAGRVVPLAVDANN